MSNHGALACMDYDAAIQQLSSGRLLKHIAAEYGVSKVAVYKRLKNHPDYQQAIIEQAESLVEQAIDEVMNCDADTVNIARARVDAAFKWAAARDPARWGQRTQVDVTVDIGSALQQIAERMQGQNVVTNVVTQDVPAIEHDVDQ